MSILQHNGGCSVAMAGEGCFAIATDLGLIQQGKNIAQDCSKVHKINNKVFVALSGLATDRETIFGKLDFRCNMHRINEEREMTVDSFLSMFSNMLYERRFGPWFVEPVIAGFDSQNNVQLASMDLIGAMSAPKDFVCTGTCEDSLMGMCEALWRPHMKPDELFEVISQALLAALDRDCISGWGAIVYVVTPTEIIRRTLKTRAD
ncbi:Proteasome subunit alpha/beta [Perkinsela sp. CCAP 1560/4]|nr:hypothetical protein XU18_2460 [Perkinsela sp. CCAP 1560/4]KNH08871.1 Proteasome subunit alpha/beta [Perkinsela sp. CCAP 1560/4]|eukprot:KNH06752.1 hypothetical protein XU18_2460 [Perkinsela sp. CCAP 1560/4]